MDARRKSRAAGRTVAALVLLAAPLAAVEQLSPTLVRARTEREWTVKAEKMWQHLQPLMRKHGVDLWLILSRENAPDPALELFGGLGITGWYGHRNAYLLYDPGGNRPLETTALGTHLSGHLNRFYGTITGYGEEGLKPHLRKFIESRDPKRIAINQSRTISMADGLTGSLREYLLDVIGPKYGPRLTSSEPLLVEYVSTHTPAEDAIEREASVATFDLLRQAMSAAVIESGVTRLMDVHYWIAAEWRKQGFEFNFPPSLDLQRPGGVSLDDAEDPVIQLGDLLHVDFGVRSSGIVTDQQKMAYVLKPGETAPPSGLIKAFDDSARAADIIIGEMKVGRTGIAIKKAAEARAKESGIEALVYSHVQGYWVHDAGVWAIFDWPERYGAHPRFALLGGEWMSLEFSTTTVVPEWGGQKVRMLREEDLKIYPDGRVEYLSGPQRELWTVD